MEPAFVVTHQAPWLIARFGGPQRMLSWALSRPGFQTAETVAWLQVADADLPPDVDPVGYLQARLSAARLDLAVGLLTSRDLGRYRRATLARGGVQADCLVTFGLSNAERVGSRRASPPGATAAGTINLLCHVSEPLSEPALLEALSVATQARTLAILEQGYAPDPGRGPVTGTGTDCIVLACPPGEPSSAFAGLHTAAGEAIGAAVLQATGEAMALWLQEQGLTSRP